MKKQITKIKVGSGYSNELPAKDGVLQGTVSSRFLFAIVIDVVTEEVRKNPFYEIL